MRVNYVESTGQKNLIKCTFDIYEKLGEKKRKITLHKFADMQMQLFLFIFHFSQIIH